MRITRLPIASFLEVLDFDLLSGDRKTALAAPNSVILTEESAMKYFNSTNVIGKAIKVDGDTLPYTITAVLKDIPVNSHISFNLVFFRNQVAQVRDSVILLVQTGVLMPSQPIFCSMRKLTLKISSQNSTN